MPENNELTVFIILSSVVLALVAAVIILFVFFSHIRRRDSDVDKLTGGKSKSRFFADCENSLKKLPAEKWEMAVIDIDRFKLINDRLGYEEGDRILARFHNTIADSLKSGEDMARISEDNFAILLEKAANNEIEEKYLRGV